jgi:hypothetical protein
MEIPKGAKTYDLRSSILWFDEEGIAYSTPKPDAPLTSTDDEIRNDINFFLEITGGKKVCIVIETASQGAPPPKAQRDLVEESLNKVVKALAIVTTSPLSKMLANLFFSFKPPAYPTKMFTNVEEATAWVKQYK